MIRPLSLDVLDEILFVPRAIVAAPLGGFAARLGLDVIDGEDDLDRFEGLVLSLNDEVPFTLTRHRGDDASKTTVSLPVQLGAIRDISAILGRIVDELHIDAKLIVWQQDRDDPARAYA